MLYSTTECSFSQCYDAANIYICRKQEWSNDWNNVRSTLCYVVCSFNDCACCSEMFSVMPTSSQHCPVAMLSTAAGKVFSLMPTSSQHCVQSPCSPLLQGPDNEECSVGGLANATYMYRTAFVSVLLSSAIIWSLCDLQTQRIYSWYSMFKI